MINSNAGVSPAMPPDNYNSALIRELVAMYEKSAARISQVVLHPPGDQSAPFAQARASSLLIQVNEELARLKKEAAGWTSTAIQSAVKKGIQVGASQAKDAGIVPDQSRMEGSFNLINHGPVRVLARELITDLAKGADGMGKVAREALSGMSSAGVSPRQVNRILAGGIIEGKPVQTIRELKQALVAVNGKKTAILCKDGITRGYDSGYYAQLMARTKTRQAVVTAKHEQFKESGIDLVKIVGRFSVHFCTAFIGHVYSISGEDKHYPLLADLPCQGVAPPGPPFHPQCSKSTVPFIRGLSKDTSQERRAAA